MQEAATKSHMLFVKRIHIKRKAVAHIPSVDAKKKEKHSQLAQRLKCDVNGT